VGTISALGLWVLAAALLPATLFADSRAGKLSLRYSAHAGDNGPAQNYWRPTIASHNSLFGAIHDFSRRADDDRMLRSRGVHRPLNFHYRNFSYERDYFHVYKGFRLRSFLDGRLDLGLYKHHFNGGMMFGPAGAYLPTTSKRIELNLRWNLTDR